MRTTQNTGNASPTHCAKTREWVKVVLGFAAGVAFIWTSAFNGNGSFWLLSFCLILLGCASPLMMLLDRLPNLFNRTKPVSKRVKAPIPETKPSVQPLPARRGEASPEPK